MRWVDKVAVLTDGAALLGDDSVDAAQEWLFTLARPDLVVCDRTYAGVAVAGGLEVVAFADLDAVALAVAAWQGRGVRIVPARRAAPTPGLRRIARPPGGAGRRPRRPASTRSGPLRRRARSASFATPAAGAYARPCGEAGETEGVSQWRNHSPRRDS